MRIAPSEHRYHTEDVPDGQTLLPALIAAGVTAVFCYNDSLAVGALLACRALGIAVPEQLSIVGFDDIELAQFVTPPLTTIHQPRLRLGQLAMEMLLDLLAERPVRGSCSATELVVRGSTAAAPAVPVGGLSAITEVIRQNSSFPPHPRGRMRGESVFIG